MTAEQLQAARAEKWRQKANPVLTLEEAEAWIASTGISLFLPRKTQLLTPAPSFVEAVLGETNATPAPAAIQNAFDLAIRLTSAGSAIALNLFGGVSEQPDFLASVEALPYVFAARGDRDWKRGPRDKSSPLVIESWKVLKREGVLTTPELQAQLGREVTEAAVLRAVTELWGALRVLPVYAAGEATAWELFESNQQKAAQTGSGMAQATALSALVSLYLDTVIAANSDEIETFLSPLAPRSRIRDVVRGIAATRQFGTLTLGSQTLYFIAGGLPEFPAIEVPAETESATEATSAEEGAPARRKPYGQRDGGERPARKPFTRGDRPTFGKRPAAGGERRPFKPRDSDGPRKEWTPRTDRPAFGRKEWKPRREGAGEERGAFRPRGEGGFKKPFRKPDGERPSGEAFEQRPPRREWTPREGQRPSFGKKEWTPRREGAGEERREFRPRRAEGSQGGKSFSKPYRRPGGDRPSGGSFQQRPPRKDWKPRTEGSSERREFKPRRTEGEFKPRREGGFGEKREFKPRRTEGSSERRDFKPRRTEGEFKPRREGGFGEKREFKPRRTEGSSERRDFKPRRTEGGFKPRREGSFGEKREFKPRRTEGSSERRDFKPRRTEGGFKPRREGGSREGGFGEKREFKPRRTEGSTERREFKPRRTEGGFKPRREGGGFGDRPKTGGERRSFSPSARPDGKKPPQRERTADGPGAKRPGKTFGRPGSRPAKPGGRSGSKFGASKGGGRKPAFGARRPSRPGGKPSFGKRPKKKSDE